MLRLDLGGLTGAQRARLAESWAEAALAEHASIGSFGRFALQLLAVGAPPELLEQAHHAALDEVRHARQSFAVASAYAGEALGPGPLPLEGDLLGPTDLRSVLVATVTEGCVGETLAAMEAEACAVACVEPEVRDILAGIAADEARHAALAWAFARWALTEDPGLADACRRALAFALGPQTPQPPADPDEQLLRRQGRPTELLRHEVRQRYRAEVLPAAAAALLG